MAAITSAGSGAWNSTTANAPWPSGTIPVSGDTITIANGHTITIPNGYTAVVGSSPADDTGTPAIQTASATGTGILVIASGGNLTYKGPIRQTNLNWTIGAGCTILHDSSGATTPSAAHYSWQIGISGTTSAKLTVSGAAGNRTTFGIAASSGASGGFHIATAVSDCGQLVATYTSFADWGTSAITFCHPSLISSGSSFTLDNCLLDRCGKISVFDCRLACNLRLKNTSIRGPVNSAGVSFETDIAGNGIKVGTVTGDWRIEHCYIEGQVILFNSTFNTTTTGFVFLDSILAGTTSTPPASTSGGMGVNSWDKMLLYNQVAATGNPSDAYTGTFTRSLLLRKGGSNNPHFIANIKGTSTWDGWIAENQDNLCVGSGDIFQTFHKSTAWTLAIKHGLALPTPDGTTGIGSIVNDSDSTAHNGTTINHPTITVEHNTWFATDNASNDVQGAGGETNVGFAGEMVSVQSNIAWRGSSGAGWVTKWGGASTPANGVYTTADFNAYSNVTGIRYERSGTNPLFYTNAPGTHDINANPSFVDNTRRFLSWAQSVDATVTNWADALNRFSLINNDSGVIAGFTIQACYDWIRAGFAPTNAALKAAGHDGADIGAVAVAATGGVLPWFRDNALAGGIGAMGL